MIIKSIILYNKSQDFIAIFKLNRKILKRACCLVKQHSKCSSIKKLKFDITQIKYIEKTNILGQVIVNKLLKQITI